MECLKALIAFGANINLRNSFGQTPLDVASMSPIGTQHVLKYACTCVCVLKAYISYRHSVYVYTCTCIYMSENHIWCCQTSYISDPWTAIFRANQLSSAGNTHSLSSAPPVYIRRVHQNISELMSIHHIITYICSACHAQSNKLGKAKTTSHTCTYMYMYMSCIYMYKLHVYMSC